MPSKDDVQFEVDLAKGDLRIPAEPARVPADSCFFWPFHLDLDGAHLVYATAQPVCRLADGLTTYYVFAEIEGVPVEFVFDRSSVSIVSAAGGVVTTELGIRVTDVRTGTAAAIQLGTEEGRRVCILLLDPEQSLSCWKANLLGQERLFLTSASFLLEGDTLRLSGRDPKTLSVSILPAPEMAGCNSTRLVPEPDGLFSRFTAYGNAGEWNSPVSFSNVKGAGLARPVNLGGEGVAEAPTDADFEQAAVWRLHLDPALDPTGGFLIRISYVGDVARLYLGGKLLTDNFYNGTPFEIGLKRYAPEIYHKELVLKILPLRKDAPIYLPPEARPDFGSAEQAVALLSVDLVEDRQVVFTAVREPQPQEAYKLAGAVSAPEA